MARLKLTDAEFEEFARLVFERSGMDIARNQRTHLELALGERMAAVGAKDAAAYQGLLAKGKDGDAEFVSFIDRLVVQETSFFRTVAHFDALRTRILPDILRDERREKTIRLWSAGCASGPEPYSLAITLLEAVGLRRGWKTEVHATDIGVSSLGEAKAALYEERIVRKTPAEIRERYFSKEGSLFRVASAVRTMVEFRRHNLMEDGYPKDVDVIFCRNVLIYFRPDSRAHILQGFHAALRPGGHLFLGHSESLRDHGETWESVWFEGGFGYRRRDATVPEPPATKAPPAGPLHRTTRRRRVETRIVHARLKSFASPSAPIALLPFRGSVEEQGITDKDRLLAAIRRQESRILLRMDDAKFIDASDVALLRRAVRMVRDYGGRVVIACPEGPVRRWIDGEENEGLFEVVGSEEEARRALDAPPAKR